MAATKLQLNWTSVSWNSTTITNVTHVAFSKGGEVQSFAGDTSVYPTVIANTMNRPRCTITSGDIAALMGFSAGTAATLNATHNDALKATGGAIVYVLSNAVLVNVDANGPFSQFGNATATFQAYSTDGTTNPLAFTRT